MRKRAPSVRELQHRIRILEREKRSLLTELDIRVGDFLQIVSSLIALSKLRTGDQQSQRVLGSVHNKIQAIALVHQSRTLGESVNRIHMGQYIHDLGNQLMKSFGRSDIARTVDAGEIHLSVRQAISVALVLNEILSNCFEHAFPDHQAGAIQITMNPAADGQVALTVRDNGIGLPADADPSAPQSLGFELIRNIGVHQLGGSLDVNRHGGTQLRLVFSVEPDSE